MGKEVDEASFCAQLVARKTRENTSREGVKILGILIMVSTSEFQAISVKRSSCILSYNYLTL